MSTGCLTGSATPPHPYRCMTTRANWRPSNTHRGTPDARAAVRAYRRPMHQLALPRIARRGAVLIGTLVAWGVIAHPALAATRYASPNGAAPVETQCTDITLPCSLDTALQTAQDEDTLSLPNGTY